jgi:hypothetical protein
MDFLKRLLKLFSSQSSADNTSRGVVIEPLKDTDWQIGGETGITPQELVPDGQWGQWLPTNERQTVGPILNNQPTVLFDTLACVTFSALNVVETQINRMVAKNEIPADKLQLLKDWGFFENGKFNASDRFTAKMSGTTLQGNSAQNVWNSIRHDGLVPESMYPSQGVKTRDEYYQPIPQNIIDFGKKILDIFDFSYEWVSYSNFGLPEADKIKQALKQSPLQVLTAVCPNFFSNEIVPTCSLAIVHATEIYGYDDLIDWLDFDSYSQNYDWNNYTHKLAWDYVLPYVMKGVVSLKTPITPPPAPQYKFTQIMKYGQTSDDIKKLQDVLKAQGLFPLTVNSTGYFGTITAKAVVAFQIKYGLIPNASYWKSLQVVQVGLKTLNKLNSL